MDIRIEIPVARAIVAHHGLQQGLGIISRLINPEDHDAAIAAYEALGSKIERSAPEDSCTTLESVFAVSEEIDPETGEPDSRRSTYWDNGGIVMFGRVFPHSVAIAASGKKVENILDHHLFRGLTVKEMVPSLDDEGYPVLVIDIDTPDCPIDKIADYLPKGIK